MGTQKVSCLAGAAEVMGTDVDPIALQAAHRNAAANGIGANFQVRSALNARTLFRLHTIRCCSCTGLIKSWPPSTSDFRVQRDIEGLNIYST